MRDQRAWLYTATLDIDVVLAEAEHHHATLRPSSPSRPILRHLIEYYMFRNWKKKQKKTGETKMFDMNIIASHKKICAGIFQLLVDKRFIQVMWTSFCINFSYNSTCLHHILSVIHYTICGAVCFQFTHFPCDDWENRHILSYHHHIGSINYYLLFMVRSWNNSVRCMSFYIHIDLVTWTRSGVSFTLVKIWKEIRNGEICCEVIQLNRFI